LLVEAPTDDVAEFWNTTAADYDRAYEAPGRAGRALRSRQEAVLRLLDAGSGEVLDAGMGPGRLLSVLSRRGWRVSGIDTSEQMVAMAARRLPDASHRLGCASVEHLPFPDRSFDAVVATGVLEYVGYSDEAISELTRVLRPGGLAILSVPDPGLVTRFWRGGFIYPLARAVKRIVPLGRPSPPRRLPPPPRERFEMKLSVAGLTPIPPSPLRSVDQLVYAARKDVAPQSAQVNGDAAQGLAFPMNYYRRIYEVEEQHWWHRGMRAITEALLGDRLGRVGDLLDVGCGTGGFLRWALERHSFGRLAGADISAEAIELARERAPDAELRVAPIWDQPFETASFDLIVLNDVLQHVPERDVDRGLREMRRLLRSEGELLIRTNAALQAREGREWRVYDRPTLRSSLERSGFRCRRLTYANLAGSLWAVVRGAAPRAATRERHGIPSPPSAPANALMYAALRAEAAYLRHLPFALPYGHTLFALADLKRNDPGTRR
jgi:ubiquinone/menaquinone biosynthesis C-methylase UbiE